jgi:hypothetical protein
MSRDFAGTLSKDSSANASGRTGFRHLPGHLFGRFFDVVSGRTTFRPEGESVPELCLGESVPELCLGDRSAVLDGQKSF